MKKFLSTILVVCLLVSVLTGCGTSRDGNTVSGDTEESRKLVVAVADIFNTLNPFATNNVSDQIVFNQVYETLFRVDTNGNPENCLAKDYTISDDGLVYTINLVEDAIFHNGENLKASDVVFTYNYAAEHAGRTIYFSMVDKIEEVGDYIVKFTLKNPAPMFFTYSQGMPILNEKFVTENKGDITQVACGTGAYQIANYDPAVAVTLEAFPDYRLGEAAIKDVEIRYVSDKSTAAISLETGEINLMSIPTNLVSKFESNPDFNTGKSLPNYTAVIAMNVTGAPFDNKLVRQAFAYAIDRQSVIDIAYDGSGKIARFMCDDANCFGVDYSDAINYTYNPEKAKQLLAEAGYPDGMDLAEFGIEMKTFSGYHSKIATIFQQNLADIGVKIDIVNTETPDEDVETGNFTIMNQGITYRSDFSYSECHYGSVGIGGNNYAQMSDPWVDEMFAKGTKETDPEQRKVIYKELIEYLIDYCPNIYIFHKHEPWAWTKDLNANIKNSTMYPYHIWEWSWNK